MGVGGISGGLWNSTFKVWEFVLQVSGEGGRGLWSFDCGILVFTIVVNGVVAGE
jgi:hypothetical protein